jgi:hypothetical protein
VLSCKGVRRFRIKLRLPAGTARRGVRVKLDGKRIAVRRRGRYARAVVDLRGRPATPVKLVARIRLRNGRTVTRRRTYHPCAARERSRRRSRRTVRTRPRLTG